MLVKKTALLKKLPLEVKTIFAAFLKDGDEIRLVGGSVRDLLLNKKVKDFDFATKFLPQDVIKILQKNNIKAIPTGIKHGTVTAVINHKTFEITTLRSDVKTDGRRADVEFVDDYFFDAARRDFTVNALYLDASGVIHDYFDGLSDLKNRRLRFIGQENDRIKEDFLRILRFFRFSLEYANKLDSKALKACVLNKENLKKLSRERIRDEFCKMLSTSNQSQLLMVLQKMQRQKILSEIFSESPDIKALQRLFDLEKKLKITTNIDLKIAVLFLKNTTNLSTFFAEICASNVQKKYLKFLKENKEKADLQGLKMLLSEYSKELVFDFYILSLLQNSKTWNISQIKNNLKFIQKFSLPQFPLSGDDIIDLGYKEKEVGVALKRAKDFWVKGDFKIEKKKLLGLLING